MRSTEPDGVICALWLSLFVAGCSAAPGQPAPAASEPAEGPPPLTTFFYECEDSTSLVAHHEKETDEVVLFLRERTVWLARQRSEAGARYTDGTITFESEGREATVDRGQGPVRCEENRRRSTFEDAKLRGVDFRGVGNEPGWTLEIDTEAIVFVTNYGQDTHRFDRPEPASDPQVPETFYRADGEGHRLIVRLSIGDGGCRDSMSGEAFETTVEVTLDGVNHRGCGTALH